MPNPTDNAAVRDEIARRAYERYCNRGCIDGCDEEDWLAAEREVLAEIEHAKPDELGVASPNPKARRKQGARG